MTSQYIWSFSSLDQLLTFDNGKVILGIVISDLIPPLGIKIVVSIPSLRPDERCQTPQN